MRTNDLRELIQIKLENIKAEYGIFDIFYQHAKPDAMYPHIVFDIDDIDMLDFYRKDYLVDIDIYTKNTVLLLDISDAVENIFIFSNDPQNRILPTFFMEHKKEVEDSDKSIKHMNLRMQVQLYDNV